MLDVLPIRAPPCRPAPCRPAAAFLPVLLENRAVFPLAIHPKLVCLSVLYFLSRFTSLSHSVLQARSLSISPLMHTHTEEKKDTDTSFCNSSPPRGLLPLSQPNNVLMCWCVWHPSSLLFPLFLAFLFFFLYSSYSPSILFFLNAAASHLERPQTHTHTHACMHPHARRTITVASRVVPLQFKSRAAIFFRPFD